MSWPTLTMRFPFPQTTLELRCGDWRPDSLVAQLVLIEQCGAFQCEGHDKATARRGFMMPRLLINWRHSATCFLEPVRPSSFACWTLRTCFFPDTSAFIAFINQPIYKNLYPFIIWLKLILPHWRGGYMILQIYTLPGNYTGVDQVKCALIVWR